MATDPLSELQAASGESQREGETVREYVTRLGTEAAIDDDLVDGTVEYITSWYYSPDDLDTDETYQLFLDRLHEAQTTDDREQAESPTASPGTDSPAESPGVELQRSDAEPPTTTADAADERDAATARPEVQPAHDPGRERAVPVDRHDDVGLGGTLGFKSGIRGKEPRKLVGRFLGIALTAPAIGWMMGRAWVPGNELYERGARLLAGLFGLGPVQALEFAGLFGLGLYLTLVVLFLFDVKKRVQGMLLLLGSGLALGVLGAMGVYLPNIDYTAPLNVGGAVLGIVFGVLVESRQLAAIDIERSTIERPSLADGTLPEFRNAARAIFGLLAVAIALSLVQVAMAETAQVVDLLASGLFLAVLFGFIQYESELRYTTLGPERSGKSMMMLGLCLELVGNADTPPTPNDYLQGCLERASNLRPGNERWPMPSTPHDEVRGASFEVIAGSYFPRRLELTALDYAGHHLGRVAELFADDAVHDDAETVPHEIAAWIDDTDTLLFILDVERLVYPESFQEAGVTDEQNVSWGFEHYGTILDHTDPDDILVVATKCDILIDQGEVDPPFVHDSFAGFTNAVTEHLTSRPDVRELLQMAGEQTIQPVYFATTKRDGEYVPRLDDSGNLVPVGYDYLIEEIKRRQ